jgi:hypothetical protein
MGRHVALCGSDDLHTYAVPGRTMHGNSGHLRGRQGQSMTAVLAGSRGRPWLVGCLTATGIGVSAVVRSRFGHLSSWIGILAITGGLLVAVGAETG